MRGIPTLLQTQSSPLAAPDGKRPAALPASFYDEAFLYGAHYGDKVQYQTSPAATNLAIRAAP
ncbi:hypothetical protein V7S43_010860 [Phytophthora oleae]|uniref:Uncharacterized protein n=1 Tax=Phytophthora oleae TaxID=2107226 RepID=A0ABD3FB62_9STRA